MEPSHYFKWNKDGFPYFDMPELEIHTELLKTEEEELILQSKYTQNFINELNASYMGKGQFDYDVTLPMKVQAFWDRFDLGILKEYARLFPDAYQEILILPFVDDERDTEYYVNELRIIANESLRRRAQEDLELRTGNNFGFDYRLPCPKNHEDFQIGFEAGTSPLGYCQAIGSERALQKREEQKHHDASQYADQEYANTFDSTKFWSTAEPASPTQFNFSPRDFPVLPGAEYHHFRSSQSSQESSQRSQASTDYYASQSQGGGDSTIEAEPPKQWLGWGCWTDGKLQSVEDEVDESHSAMYDYILNQLHHEIAANPECGSAIRTLPDITSTSQLFSDDYRGGSILSDTFKSLDKEMPNLSATTKKIHESTNSQYCDSFGFFNPNSGNHQRISAKARDNFEDIYGKYTILNSKIGRYEYFSTPMHTYFQAAPGYPPPGFQPIYQQSSQSTQNEDLGLEDSFETPIRYSFCSDNYDPETLQPIHNLSTPDSPNIKVSSFQIKENTIINIEDDFSKIADNIFLSSQSPIEDNNDEYEDFTDEEEDEDAEEEDPPIIEINCTRYRTYKGNSTSVNSHRLPTNRRRRNYLCVFCKGNNEPEDVYKSHPIRVNGVVMCPFLRNHVCAICKDTGHTIKYCPQNRRGFFAQKALEKSRLTIGNGSTFNKGIGHTLVFTPSNGNGVNSRRPYTAPAALPTQTHASPRQGYQDQRKKEVFDFDNNYRGTVFMVKKTTAEDTSESVSGWSEKNNAYRSLRRGRGGGRKKRAQAQNNSRTHY